MRVLVLEYLHAQSDAYQHSTESMRTEGRQMLTAVVEELHTRPDTQVTVPVCSAAVTVLSELPCRLQEVPNCVEFEFPERLLGSFAANDFDCALVVAPETAGILRRIVQRLRHAGFRVVAPSLQSISLCSDKLATYQFLQRSRIRAIPSVPLAQLQRLGLTADQLVAIKPLDGAGGENVVRTKVSQFETSFLSAVSQALGPGTNESTVCEPEYLRTPENFLVQPFIRGRSFSVAAFGQGEDSHPVILPVCEQAILWENDVCRYTGGVVNPNVTSELSQQLIELTQRVCHSLHLRLGYLGIDFVVDEISGQAYVAELNPRLCTSFVGYHRLLGGDLISSLLQIDGATVPAFSTDSLAFRVA